MKISILPRCRAEAIAVSTGQTRGVYSRAPTAASGAKLPFTGMSVSGGGADMPHRRAGVRFLTQSGPRLSFRTDWKLRKVIGDREPRCFTRNVNVKLRSNTRVVIQSAER